MVFYKDLNERFISENPTNTVSTHQEDSLSSCQAGGFHLATGGSRPGRGRKPGAAWGAQSCSFTALLPGTFSRHPNPMGYPKHVQSSPASHHSRVGRRGPHRQQGKGSRHSVPNPGHSIPAGTHPQELLTSCSLLFQIVILLSNFGGQLGLWMSCSVVCVIEIVEVFFIDSLSIVMRRQWQKAKKWWNDRKREGSGKHQVGDVERQGHDNPVCIDEDLPTFNTALRLPLPQESHLPRTPPPNYSTLRLETAFTEQLPDTLEAGQH